NASGKSSGRYRRVPLSAAASPSAIRTTRPEGLRYSPRSIISRASFAAEARLLLFIIIDRLTSGLSRPLRNFPAPPEFLPDAFENPAELVPPAPVAAVAPVRVVARVLDERRVARRQQRLAQPRVLRELR